MIDTAANGSFGFAPFKVDFGPGYVIPMTCPHSAAERALDANLMSGLNILAISIFSGSNEAHSCVQPLNSRVILLISSTSSCSIRYWAGTEPSGVKKLTPTLQVLVDAEWAFT